MKNKILNVVTVVCHGEDYAKASQNSIEKGERYYCIDLLKALSILLVVIGHGDLMNYDVLHGGAWGYIHYYLRGFLSVCVPLFFFANGFLLFNKKLNLKKHIMGMIKLVFLTMLWGIITLIVIMPAKGEYMNLKQLIFDLWHWKMGWINHLWFMGALVIVHLFFPLLKLAFDKKNSIFVYFLTVCFIFTFGNKALNMMASFIKPVSSENFFNFFNPFRNIYGYTFVYFMAGGIAGRYYKLCRDYVLNNKKKVAVRSAAVFLLSCFVFTAYSVIITYKMGNGYENIFDNFSSIFALINVLCVYFLSLLYNKHCKPIEIIGKNTMGIYFIHMIIIDYTKPYLNALADINSIFIYVLYGAVVLLVSLAIALVIKKIPLLRIIV